MTNADVVAELAELRQAADELTDLLTKSDTLPALPLAGGLVEASKLTTKLKKLAVVLGAVAAPLFGDGGKKPGDDADGPGSNTETSRALLLRADLALVPCKASMLEVRALAQATNVLRQSQDIRGGQPSAMIILSMVGKTYRLTQDMKDAAAALELPLAKTALTLRQIYADAPGQAAVVWQLGARGSEAAAEVKALFREVLPEACASAKRQAKKAAG